MARGRQQNFKNGKKGKFKHGNVQKKKEKKFSNRDITHRDQYIRAKELEKREQSRRAHQLTDENTCEEPEIDLVDQLLSTFNESANSKNNIVDSDESSEDEEIELKADNIEEEPDKSDPEPEVDSADEKDDLKDDEDDESDPFTEHFSLELDSSLLNSLQITPPNVTLHKINWPVLGDLKIEIPNCSAEEIPGKERMVVLEEQRFAKPGKVSQRITELNFNSLFVKSQLHSNIKQANEKALGQSLQNGSFTPLQKELFAIINNYQDLYYPNRDLKNGEEVRFIYCVHTVNHILKTRLKVIHHNERLNKKDRAEIPDEFRDQGLVRPKVLIVVPFRDSCFRIVNMIASILLSDNRSNMINKSRFKEEFTGNELFMPKKNRKPEDFEQLFTGNVGDSFRIGLNFTKKSLKLYSDFYSSDVIISSPLGLRMLIGAEGDKERDFDFLASIEVLILDQAEVFLMQNWEHVTHFLNHMHIQPKESHGTNFSRVRTWALNGWAQFYRQTLLFSSLVTAELNAIFFRSCKNYAGSVRTVNAISPGAISRVVIPLPHVYRRFETTSIVQALDDRFQFFVDEILPQYAESHGVLLYVPSYFDYVRLRNHLKSQDFSFVQICEYSKDAKVARARDMFFHNEARILLYSERFHFFRRVAVKGIRHIIFYQPPTFPSFYTEMCNLMQERNQNKTMLDANLSVCVIYCKYDAHQLSGIVSTARASRIVKSPKSVYMFTTGQK